MEDGINFSFFTFLPTFSKSDTGMGTELSSAVPSGGEDEDDGLTLAPGEKVIWEAKPAKGCLDRIAVLLGLLELS